MKCPNCGKKMKKDTCKACGYNPAAKAEEAATALNASTKVNYFTYDPKNPGVVYPMSVSGQAQANPAFANAAVAAEAPVSKKEAKKAAKAAKKASSKKAVKKAAKEAEAAEKKAAKQAAVAEQKAAKAVATKNWVSRLFAVVLMLVSVAALLVLSFGAVLKFVTVGENAVPDIQSGSLWVIFATALKSETKLFGVLPALFTGEGGMLYNVAIYVFVLCAIVAALYAVVANVNTDKAPKLVRKSLFFLGLGALVYTVSMALLLNTGVLPAASLSKVNMIVLAGFYFDMFSLILAGVCLLLSYILFLNGKIKNK